MVYELVWHAHHEAQSPLEVLTESFEDRMKTIDTVKAEFETPEQITQRKLFIKKFEGEIPPSLIQDLAEYDKAWAERNKASAEYDKAGDDLNKASAEYWKALAEFDKASAERNKASAEYDKAWAKFDKAWAELDKDGADLNKARTELYKLLLSPKVMVLHSEQCGCNWSPTNRNIFNLTKPERKK